MVPTSLTVCYVALDPPVGGTFHFENYPTGRLRGSRNKLSEEVICDALGPLGGTFVLEISLMPPLPKTCQKAVSVAGRG